MSSNSPSHRTYFRRHSCIRDSTRGNSFSPYWGLNDQISLPQQPRTIRWQSNAVMCPAFAFVIDRWRGCDYPQSAAKLTAFHLQADKQRTADHYHCLGLLLTSLALPVCHAPGSATCYNSDNISNVFFFFLFFFPSLSPFSFTEVSEIHRVSLSRLNFPLSINSQETEWGKSNIAGGKKQRGKIERREQKR